MAHERRVFVDLKVEVMVGEELTLPPQTVHYLFKVLRLRAGSPVVAVSHNTGWLLDCEAAPPHSITVIAKRPLERENLRTSSLAVALSKGSTNETVLQKGVELGVSHFNIWSSEHSVVKINNPEDLLKKMARWSKIIEAAACQSGRSSLPSLSFAPSIENLIQELTTNKGPQDRLLVCSLSEDAKNVAELDWFEGRAHVVVGPEGDLTKHEEDALRQADFLPISLGSTRLKVDTAAIAAVSLIEGALLTREHLQLNTALDGRSE
jgi:16S rRNA (uracil1498-N3)-methyltransferase